ncbi:lytic transglycosylase domain-containing protein [Arcanobacterium buesumense]|uniref:LysM peptidoglycan-binding domain-containing protein n=1 Tax=Arcanobacterium buesumense TaxID=2722751 RepID=A0A6H2ELA3_9ACTO|nr:lytic transglycosylase domain-containing protein [Arcanobacterium buesumense]QJC21677.1 LysM peptidoglycan-binding domain-containing protein [Arcanobacterium buesumense]
MSTWMSRSNAALATATAVTLLSPTVASAAQAQPATTPQKSPIQENKSPQTLTMTYQVRTGDTVWGISQRTGIPMADIIRTNNLDSTALIRIGQRLLLPVQSPVIKDITPVTHAAPKTTPAPSSTTYTVQSGDTLGAIAHKLGTTVAHLVAANNISNPNLIYPGQQLSINATPAPAPAPAPAPTPAPAPAATPAPSSTTYTVQSGDTLGAIAHKLGTTVAHLVAANNISNPNLIYPGQQLSINATPAPTPTLQTQISTKKRLVENNFPGYTYADEVVDAANDNKNVLINQTLPSREEMQRIIRQTAAQMGVDPRLALAHAYIESGFDASAVSPANAIGTMQVIPSSGSWAGTMVGRELNLLDPHDNVVAGIAIIRYLHNNADNFDQAVAGYYQGLGGVKRYGMRPDTVAYVAKIKAAMARF